MESVRLSSHHVLSCFRNFYPLINSRRECPTAGIKFSKCHDNNSLPKTRLVRNKETNRIYLSHLRVESTAIFLAKNKASEKYGIIQKHVASLGEKGSSVEKFSLCVVGDIPMMKMIQRVCVTRWINHFWVVRKLWKKFQWTQNLFKTFSYISFRWKLELNWIMMSWNFTAFSVRNFYTRCNISRSCHHKQSFEISIKMRQNSIIWFVPHMLHQISGETVLLFFLRLHATGMQAQSRK